MPHQNTQTVDVWFTSSTEVSVTTAPYPRIHCASGETFAQKERVSGPCQYFPKDLNYTDWLIRSALIAISDDRNNMKLCVCHTHPSLAVLRCVQFCPAPCPSCLELVSEWALWRWWMADVAGALRMVWGQTLDWTWRAFKERQALCHYAPSICHSAWSYTDLYSTPQWPGLSLVTQSSTTGLHLCYIHVRVCKWPCVFGLTVNTLYVMLRSVALCCLCVLPNMCNEYEKHMYHTSPFARRKCWQFMFLHTTDVFTSVGVIGCIPNWNLYKTYHITFTLNVYDLTFILWRRRGWWCQATDRSSRLYFNICKCDITGYYLRRPQDNFQLCLFGKKQKFLAVIWGIFQPCLWQTRILYQNIRKNLINLCAITRLDISPRRVKLQHIHAFQKHSLLTFISAMGCGLPARVWDEENNPIVQIYWYLLLRIVSTGWHLFKHNLVVVLDYFGICINSFHQLSKTFKIVDV